MIYCLGRHFQIFKVNKANTVEKKTTHRVPRSAWTTATDYEGSLAYIRRILLNLYYVFNK